MTTHNIRDQKIETLNELIAVTRDSAKFYGEAATKTSNAQLKDLFQSMAASKNGLIGAMAKDVQAEGASAETDGTFRGTLNRMYGEVRAKLGNDDYAYVAQLEESEDRMLHAFKDVLQEKDTPTVVREAVSKYLPTVKEHHDAMRDRKWAMASTRH